MSAILVVEFNTKVNNDDLITIKEYLAIKDLMIENNIIIVDNFHSSRDELLAFKEMLEAELGKRCNIYYLYDLVSKEKLFKLKELGIVRDNLIIQGNYLFELAILEKNNYQKYIDILDMNETKLKDSDLDFIISFYQGNGNIAFVARNEYMHRNSILYQIDKIYRLTGLNPKNFWDLRMLYLYALIAKLMNK
ncbi:MAG: helix-turn-helix domain-containing protein [Erysipelotrichaceae bacterium]|nr:helix-turn-helix domain-containing protein [Erysipelotrichaceae bacterium]